MGTLLIKRLQSNHLWLHILLILGSITTLMPFILMLSTSLKTSAEVMTTTPLLLPKAWRWENYVDAFEQIPFLRFYWNTIFVTVCRVIGQLIIASMAAYAFARIKFPGRDILFIGIIAVMMVPSQVTLIPNYIILKNLNWLDSYQGLIIPSLFTAFGTFLLRQFFMTIPNDIEDAAILDGCNPFQVYYKIALPLAGPSLAALGLLITLWSWNDFLWPLIITNSTNMQMLSVGLAYFQGQYTTNYAVMMAAATLASLPLFVIFIWAQKSLIEGITTSGLKQ